MADANPQAPEILGAHVGGDVFETIVATESATELEAQLAGGNVELVMYDEDFRRSDAIETRQCSHRLAGAVHESLGHQQPHAIAAGIGGKAVKTCFLAE